MAPGYVARSSSPRRRHARHVQLVVVGPGPLEQRPVQRARGHVEGRRVYEHLAAGVPVQPGHLLEAYVVADAEADLPAAGLEARELVAGAEGVALPERHLALDVDVEQVHLGEIDRAAREAIIEIASRHHV